MPRVYRLTKAGLRLLYKVRHHKGHGIHSPFVFDLINKVIEEKTAYYAYETVYNHIESNLGDAQRRIKKYHLLLFRMVNYFDSDNILEIGSDNGISTLYLTASSNDIRCICIEKTPRKLNAAKKLYSGWNKNIETYTKQLPLIEGKIDCISINLKSYDMIDDHLLEMVFELMHEKSFIIVNGIRTNKHNQMLWRKMKAKDTRTAVLDLFDIGIIFFNRALYRWEYTISF